MTLEQLDTMFALRAKLRELEERRQELISAAGLRAVHLDGMPHGNHDRGDTIGDYVARVDRVDEMILQVKNQIAVLEPEIDAFTRTIPDNRLMLAFRLRFVHCLQWKEVSEMAGFPSRDAARRAVYTYLRTIES